MYKNVVSIDEKVWLYIEKHNKEIYNDILDDLHGTVHITSNLNSPMNCREFVIESKNQSEVLSVTNKLNEIRNNLRNFFVTFESEKEFQLLSKALKKFNVRGVFTCEANLPMSLYEELEEILLNDNIETNDIDNKQNEVNSCLFSMDDKSTDCKISSLIIPCNIDEEKDEDSMKIEQCKVKSFINDENLHGNFAIKIHSTDEDLKVETNIDNSGNCEAVINDNENNAFVLKCKICCEIIQEKELLLCLHPYCQQCMKNKRSKRIVCQFCDKIYEEKTGYKIDGIMGCSSFNKEEGNLKGHEGQGIIQIKFIIQDGLQTEDHPNPSKAYRGLRANAFLPDSNEGRILHKLIRKAFDNGAIFLIKDNTNRPDQVVFQENLTFKFSKMEYPDDEYFTLLKNQLAQLGLYPY